MEKEEQKLWLWIVVTTVVASVGAWVVWEKLVVPLWVKPGKIRRHFLSQGVGGPPPKPVIGNMKEIGDLMAAAMAQPMDPPNSHNILPRVLPFFHEWKKIYGSTFVAWFGPIARVVISDPVLIREILATSSDLYENYEAHPLVKKLQGNGLLSLVGQKWAYHRKIISPVFHIENLKLMVPIMTSSVASMIEKWSVICASEYAEIDVHTAFESLSEEVITRTVFGGCYEDGKVIYELQSQQMVLAGESFKKVFIPGYKFLPTRRNRKSWRLDREINTLLRKLVEKKRKSMEGHCPVDESGPRDLLEHLIVESLKKKEKNESEVKITVEDIMEECKTFFFAGKTSTANLMVWTTVVLAMHPEWQSLAREEVFGVCGVEIIYPTLKVGRIKA